jgi:hypothetical protein
MSSHDDAWTDLVAVTAAAPRGRVTDMGLLRQVLNGLRSL